MDLVENYLKAADLYDILPQNEGKLTWICIDHEPTTWGLGILRGNALEEIEAKAIRKPDGSWNWFVSGYNRFAPYGGNEPSRILAMAKAEQHIKAVNDL